MNVRVDTVTKRFGNFTALDQVSLEAREGEFLALLGPSGSGKTTLLRIIAGLEFPEAGAVWFGEQDVTHLPVKDRRVGFVFQHYALFKHMRVWENVAFGLAVRKRRDRPTRPERRRRADELLELVKLGDLGMRYPAQLSGGQRQRVALARALAVEPRLLLLDEPFGALDAKVRKELRRWLRDLHNRMGITTIFVTHDQEEALELADRVVVMRDGQLEQVAPPQEIYDTPATPFVYGFVGDSNCIPVTCTGRQILYFDRALKLPIGSSFQGPGMLYFRPEDTEISQNEGGALPLMVDEVVRLGGQTRVEGRAPGSDRPLEVQLPRGTAPTVGQRIPIKITRASLFPTDGATNGPHHPRVNDAAAEAAA